MEVGVAIGGGRRKEVGRCSGPRACVCRHCAGVAELIRVATGFEEFIKSLEAEGQDGSVQLELPINVCLIGDVFGWLKDELWSSQGQCRSTSNAFGRCMLEVVRSCFAVPGLVLDANLNLLFVNNMFTQL